MFKRGLSDVVATVIIIALVIVAIAVVWLGVMPLIKDKMGSSDVCNSVDVSIESSQGYTCWAKDQNLTLVQIKKGSSEVNISKIKFAISYSGNSISYTNTTSLQKNSFAVFYLNTTGVSGIDKIEAVPFVKTGNNEKACSAVFIEKPSVCGSSSFSAQEILVIQDSIIKQDSGQTSGGNSQNLPTINIVSPINNSVYTVSSVWLNATSNQIVSWKYSLNGGTNISFNQNVSLGGLTNGNYNIAIYANNSNGIGSTVVNFSVNVPSSAKQITSFNFTSPVSAVGTIYQNNYTIYFTLPTGTVVTNMVASVNVSQYATVNSFSNFANPVNYTVIAEDGSKQNYTVYVSVLPFSGSGGVVTYFAGYTIHTFTSSGTFVANGPGNVEVLVVAGGGGGGGNWAGGGGAGGLVYNSSYTVLAGTYNITIGFGGLGGVSTNNGANGGNSSFGNSSFGNLVAVGGGGGGGNPSGGASGLSGASGGGGQVGSGAAGISNYPSQGNSGGIGGSSISPGYTGGGGGGAGSNGRNGNSGGNGGNGSYYNLSGTNICYAGGGGGGGHTTTFGVANCGGGNGASASGGIGSSATSNTGGGGGGGGGGSGSGGNGANGVVIVRYLTS